MTDTATKTMASITDAQITYVVIERDIAAHEAAMKPLREELNAARDAVIAESGIRVTGEKVFFQDSYGVVHCVDSREFITVPVHPYGINHTRRPEFGEAKGSLSEKGAKDAGFVPVINKGDGDKGE